MSRMQSVKCTADCDYVVLAPYVMGAVLSCARLNSDCEKRWRYTARNCGQLLIWVSFVLFSFFSHYDYVLHTAVFLNCYGVQSCGKCEHTDVVFRLQLHKAITVGVNFVKCSLKLF